MSERKQKEYEVILNVSRQIGVCVYADSIDEADVKARKEFLTHPSRTIFNEEVEDTFGIRRINQL